MKSEEATEGPQLEILDSDGTRRVLERIHGYPRVDVDICPDGDLFASWGWSNPAAPRKVVLWSMSASQPLATHSYEGAVWLQTAWNGRRLILLVTEDGLGNVDALGEDGSYRRLGTMTTTEYTNLIMDSQTGRWLGAIQGNEVVVLGIGDTNLGEFRRLGRHPGANRARFHPRGNFLVTMSPDGEIRIWDPTGSSEPRILEGPPGLYHISLTGDGRVLTAYAQHEGEDAATLWSVEHETPRLLRRFVGDVPWANTWDPVGRRFKTFAGQAKDLGLLQLSAPPDTEPISIVGFSWNADFHPHGDWLSTTGYDGSMLWHLARPLAVVIARLPQPVFDLEFEREGRFLAAAGGRNYWVRLWPLEGDVPAAARTMLETHEHGHFYGVAVSPDGGQLLVSTQSSGALLMPVSGGPARALEGFKDAIIGGAFSPSGRLAAVPGELWTAAPAAVHLWDVATGKHLGAVATGSIPHRSLHFLSEDRFLVATETGFMKLGVDGAPGEVLLEGSFRRFEVSADGSRALLLEGKEPVGGPERAVVFDLETGEATQLTSHGSGISSVAIDEAGLIAVTGNSDGEIRVGPITGEEPHLLLGHSGTVDNVAVDPLGRWIASAGHLGDLTVRLWPMPDLSKPPLHTLPREELIAKLKTLTNLRVVRDEESATGWKLTVGPFPGWETVPSW